VQALYQALLGRTASSAEVDAQVNALPQVGQQALALAFLHSPEFRAIVVRGYFTNLLGRPGSPEDVAGWVSSPLDLRALRLAFEASQECFTVNARRTPTTPSFSVPAWSQQDRAVTFSVTASNAGGTFYPLSYTWTVTGPDGTPVTTLDGASVTFTPPEHGSYG